MTNLDASSVKRFTTQYQDIAPQISFAVRLFGINKLLSEIVHATRKLFDGIFIDSSTLKFNYTWYV